jgi:competence protein ComEA
MNKNKQFAIFVLILFLIGIAAIKAGKSKKTENSIKKINIKKIESPKVVEKGKIEVNQADIRELVSVGISLKISEKIVNYREKTGCIINIEEIDCLSGIGVKTMEKIRERLYVDTTLKLRKNILNINKVSEEELIWLGLTKKESKNIIKWKNSNGDINSNLDLIDIIGDVRYRDIKDRVVYQNY